METLDTEGLRAALRGAQRGPGVVTNYFLESLEASSFPVLRSEHSLVFLDLRATGWQVFYATREPADLTRLLQHLSREPLICDVRVRVGESAYGAEIPAAFQAAAFEQIARYIRMTTLAIAMHPSRRAVVAATRADADAVDDLLQLAFDPRGEHLPRREELVRWLDLGQVLVHRTGQVVDGLCIWQLDGPTCHWRFWTTRPGTHPAVAVGLLGDMVAELARRGVSRTVLWVHADKAGPRATYQRLGFRDDGVETHVYTPEERVTMDGWIRDAVLMALASYNESLPGDSQINLEGDPSLRELDSLAITNVIVAVEGEVAAAGDVEISLTDEETLRLLQDPEQTPFRSLATLCAHVARAVERARS